MKLLCILLFSGVTCCLAVLPDCYEREVRKCPTTNDVDVEDPAFRLDEVSLGIICQMSKCPLDVAEKCGVYNNGVKKYKKTYDILCRPMSKYMKIDLIESMNCMIDVMRTESYKKCKVDPQISDDRVEYCKRVDNAVMCFSDTVYRNCGETAFEVHSAYYNDKELYGC